MGKLENIRTPLIQELFDEVTKNKNIALKKIKKRMSKRILYAKDEFGKPLCCRGLTPMQILMCTHDNFDIKTFQAKENIVDILHSTEDSSLINHCISALFQIKPQYKKSYFYKKTLDTIQNEKGQIAK